MPYIASLNFTTMNTILLIISIILFHLPLALYKDTIRRYQRMVQYNPMKAYDYDFNNGYLMETSLSVIIYFISSLLFALFPLIGGLGLNWIIAIILNLVLAFFIIPFIAFSVYPTNSILTKRSLVIISAVSIVVAIILWRIGLQD